MALTLQQWVDYRAEVLEQLIDLSLLAQFAMNQGMELSEAELDERFQAAIASNGVATGYTEDEYRSALRQEILAARTIGAITDVLPLEVGHTSARHILVATREEAETLLDELANGAEFGTLAVIHSRDPGSRPAGGELGWFPKGLLTMLEVEEAAFSPAAWRGQRRDRKCARVPHSGSAGARRSPTRRRSIDGLSSSGSR